VTSTFHLPCWSQVTFAKYVLTKADRVLTLYLMHINQRLQNSNMLYTGCSLFSLVSYCRCFWKLSTVYLILHQTCKPHFLSSRKHGNYLLFNWRAWLENKYSKGRLLVVFYCYSLQRKKQDNGYAHTCRSMHNHELCSKQTVCACIRVWRFEFVLLT